MPAPCATATLPCWFRPATRTRRPRRSLAFNAAGARGTTRAGRTGRRVRPSRVGHSRAHHPRGSRHTRPDRHPDAPSRSPPHGVSRDTTIWRDRGSGFRGHLACVAVAVAVRASVQDAPGAASCCSTSTSAWTSSSPGRSSGSSTASSSTARRKSRSWAPGGTCGRPCGAWFACATIVATAIVAGICDYYAQILFATAGHRAVTAVRRDLFAHMQRLSLDFHRRRSPVTAHAAGQGCHRDQEHAHRTCSSHSARRCCSPACWRCSGRSTRGSPD